MGIQAPAEVKFRLIQNATRRDDYLLSIKLLCEIGSLVPDITTGSATKESVRHKKKRIKMISI